MFKTEPGDGPRALSMLGKFLNWGRDPVIVLALLSFLGWGVKFGFNLSDSVNQIAVNQDLTHIQIAELAQKQAVVASTLAGVTATHEAQAQAARDSFQEIHDTLAQIQTALITLAGNSRRAESDPDLLPRHKN
jgi:hypothetical protein